VIWDYAAKTGVKSVKFGCYMPTIGYTASSSTGVLTLNFSWTAAAPAGAAGGAPFADGGLWL
jgi:hypothetical protein